jgi:hypothetical protein
MYATSTAAALSSHLHHRSRAILSHLHHRRRAILSSPPQQCRGGNGLTPPAAPQPPPQPDADIDYSFDDSIYPRFEEWDEAYVAEAEVAEEAAQWGEQP